MIFKSALYGIALFYCQLSFAQFTPLQPLSQIENPKIIEITSSIPNEKIRLEYKEDKSKIVLKDISIHYEQQKQIYKVVDGIGAIDKIIAYGVWTLPPTYVKETSDMFEFEHFLEYKRYEIYLKYPITESREKVLDLLCSELGIQYTKSNSMMEVYRATWNGKTFSLPTTTKEASFRKKEWRQYVDIPMNDILKLIEIRYKVHILNGTGYEDRLSGMFGFPIVFEDMKQYLQSDMGITLQPSMISAKKITVQPK